MKRYSWRALRGTVGISVLGLLIIGSSAAMGFIFFKRGQQFLGEEQQLRLHSMVTIAALGFSIDDINQIHVAEDYKKPAYSRLVNQLIGMREENPDIRFAYIFRPTVDPNTFEFVADADSLDPYVVVDLNKDGTIDDSDTLAPPGTPYDISDTPELHDALTAATNTSEPYSDQWGTYMAGFAPIKDADNNTVAVVGFDIDIAHYNDLSQRIFSPALYTLLLLVAAIFAAIIVFLVWKRRVEALHSIDQERAKLLLLTLHQLGTPLTLVRWATDNLQQLESQVTDVEGKQSFTKNITTLTEAGNRFDTILRLLRKADQVQGGRLEYKAKEVNIVKIIESSVANLKFVLNERQQTVAITNSGPLLCMLDEEQIGVVLTELITNSSHFSPRKSTITVAASVENNAIHVQVQDQGAGIAHNDLKHLFEEFSRGEKAAEHHPDGYGLGLFITKGIIDNANGKIWIESKAGQGTIIHFTLPQ